MSAITIAAVALTLAGAAGDREAQRATRTAVTAIETYYTDHQTYVGATRSALIALDPSLADDASLRVDRRTRAGYRITVRSVGGRTFRARRRATTGIRFTCAPQGKGACPADGRW